MRTIHCIDCGVELIVDRHHNAQKRCAMCRGDNRCKDKRFSGLRYRNTPERLAEIKEKYKNGITLQMLEEMFL